MINVKGSDQLKFMSVIGGGDDGGGDDDGGGGGGDGGYVLEFY